MRGKIVGAFALGFAVGTLALGVGLWSTGRLQSSVTPPWRQPQLSIPPVAATLPDLNTTAKMQPAPEPPPLIEPPAPNSGEASRLIPSLPEAPAPHLASPLDGIDIGKLHDNFTDARGGQKHEALDIAAPRGTPVKAVAEGNVTKLFTSKDGGLTVYQFDNSGKFCFYYAHLDRYAPSLKEGMLLRTGDVLGYVGTTGNAPPNAPHLHLAVFRLDADKKWWHGTAIDPLPLLK